MENFDSEIDFEAIAMNQRNLYPAYKRTVNWKKV